MNFSKKKIKIVSEKHFLVSEKHFLVSEKFFAPLKNGVVMRVYRPQKIPKNSNHKRRRQKPKADELKIERLPIAKSSAADAEKITATCHLLVGILRILTTSDGDKSRKPTN